MLGRAGPTRIKVRLLFEPIEKVDLAGAQVKGPLVTQRIRSAEAAVVLLQGGETVLLPKQKPTGSVDAEVVLDVLPRTPSFAQVGADEGRDPFWYWDGLWLFRDQGATSALSARGERFVWEHVAESFFRLSPRIPSDAISRHQPLLVQIDGDIDDFRRRFPSLSLNIKEHRPGMRFVFTHLPTDLGDRGALEFSEQLAGSSWVLDVSGGVRRFILKQPKRQLRQIKP